MQNVEIWNEQSKLQNFVTPDRVEFMDSLKIDKSSVILDLGCGYGRTLHGLWNLGYKKLIGIDYSDGMLDVARRNNPEIKFIKGAIPNELPVINECNVVYFLTVANCIISDYDLYCVFKYIHNILVKDGVLVFDDYIFSTEEGYKRRYISGLIEFGHYGLFRSNMNEIFRHRSKSTFNNIISEFFNIENWFIQNANSMNNRITKLINYIGRRK